MGLGATFHSCHSCLRRSVLWDGGAGPAGAVLGIGGGVLGVSGAWSFESIMDVSL